MVTFVKPKQKRYNKQNWSESWITTNIKKDVLAIERINGLSKGKLWLR
jgi:hypothetical protein